MTVAPTAGRSTLEVVAVRVTRCDALTIREDATRVRVGAQRRDTLGREINEVNYFTQVAATKQKRRKRPTTRTSRAKRLTFMGVCVYFYDRAEEKVGKASVDEPWSPGSHPHAR